MGPCLRGLAGVKEIWNKHDVVVASEVDFEGVAHNCAEAVGNPAGFGVFTRDFEDGSPVERDDVGVRKFLGEANAPHPMASGDIKDLRGSVAVQWNQSSQAVGGGSH